MIQQIDIERFCRTTKQIDLTTIQLRPQINVPYTKEEKKYKNKGYSKDPYLKNIDIRYLADSRYISYYDKLRYDREYYKILEDRLKYHIDFFIEEPIKQITQPIEKLYETDNEVSEEDNDSDEFVDDEF
jgi:hypothetical protein